MQVQKQLAQAIEYHKAGKIEEAEKLYNQILQTNRNNPNVFAILSMAYSGLGDSYWDKGNIKIATDNYLKAIKLNPKNFEAYNNLGMLYSSQKMLNEAISCYEKALKINPNCAEIHNNLGTVYFDRGEVQKALNCHEQAIRIKPDYAEAFYNLGNAYKNSKNYEKALACYSKAIELKPDFVQAYVNLGLVHHYRNEPKKELICYRKAEELAPNSAEVLNNIGNMQRDAVRLEQAIEYFEKAIQYDPQKDDAYVNAAISYLALKNFDKGWKYYQRRLNDNHIYQEKIKRIKQPVWTGQPLQGKTLYVYYEQGFGDSINFVRFLSVLNSMDAKVLFQPQKELIDLFKINDLKAEVIANEPVEFDYHVPLLSIPGILGVNDKNIGFSGKYLNADPEKVQFYKEKYFNNDCFKLGINWQCRNAKHVDIFRSVPHISDFYPFLRLPNIKIYSFQKGCGTDQLNTLPDDIKIINLGDDFKDFSDTAAALENIDLLITVDTAVSHLAGALGRSVWALLQTVPDFRWFLEGEATQWYDSMKLFRQSSPNQWEEVINRVYQELQCMPCMT
ncbi:MAG: hypothetical protein A2Y25_05735 [Candidatus Melainabacteria bacterium GWF2_37_15]|nr:MAG: hypothetical protein A2Y25_05735 [Candidatus Melainabacteria bacterium GWF2_37_15]